MIPLPPAELERIAAEYRSNFANDAKLRKPTAIKDGYIKISNAAISFLREIAQADSETVDHMTQELELFGNAELKDLLRDVDALASLARTCADEVQPWSRSAPMEAAYRLRELFESLQMKFAASANADYGTNSGAVNALMAVANMAGDKMGATAARKWIERAIKDDHEMAIRLALKQLEAENAAACEYTKVEKK